jgi:vanillate monooxygenase ferredoxin subunit
MTRMRLEVAAIDRLTPAIKRFSFVAADGEALPAWEAGAHIVFELANGLHNSYSLAHNPSERDRYVTAVLRETDGKGGSAYLHDEVEIGSVLWANGPNNNFPLAPHARAHLLIAGGIGITPLLAMGYRLRDLAADFHLHYCTRSPAETAFLPEVMEVFADRLTLHHDGGEAEKGIDLAPVLKTPAPGQHLYICGPPGLLNAARTASSHWPAGTVHFELFTSTRAPGEIAALREEIGDDSFVVELRKSGLTLMVPAGRSILKVLLDHKIDILYACEEGWCGNCKTRCLGGKVDHRDEYLSDTEREQYLQVCISRAAPGERKLVLDL